MKPTIGNGLILAGLSATVALMLGYARWFSGEDLQQPTVLLPIVFLTQIAVHWIALRQADPDGHIVAALMISNALLFVALILRWDHLDTPEWSVLTGLMPRIVWHRSPGPPAWWPLAEFSRSGALWPNVVLFCPLFATWLGIGWLIRRARH